MMKFQKSIDVLEQQFSMQKEVIIKKTQDIMKLKEFQKGLLMEIKELKEIAEDKIDLMLKKLNEKDQQL